MSLGVVPVDDPIAMHMHESIACTKVGVWGAYWSTKMPIATHLHSSSAVKMHAKSCSKYSACGSLMYSIESSGLPPGVGSRIE